MTPKQVVGTALRMRRWSDGQSAKAAASAARVSHPTWGRLERGLPVRAETASKIDAHYGLEPGTTAGALGDLELARQFGATLNPGTAPDAPVPDISGGDEQVRAALRSMAELVTLVLGRVPEVEALVSAQPKGTVPDEVYRVLVRLRTVAGEAQGPLFRASTSADEDALAAQLLANERRGDQERDRGQAGTG